MEGRIKPSPVNMFRI